MESFVRDAESLATRNGEFRRVSYTPKNCQRVLKALKPHEEIEAEVHPLGQFLRAETRTGDVILDGVGRHTRAAAKSVDEHFHERTPT